MNIHDSVSRISTKRIVHVPRGSWRHQDAYRLNEYHAEILADGRAVYHLTWSSHKLSYPQLRRQGLTSLRHGGQHNQPVPRAVAVVMLGRRETARLERRGVRFVGEI
jgi:hypothetical protein